MKIILISDTHNRHHDLELPDGDMIIHAGDVSSTGKEPEILDFLNWFKSLDYKYKIFIAGNHDFYFERANSEQISLIIPENLTYLNDSGVTIEGLKIWGSPVQPEFNNWAFNREIGDDIRQHWDLIPVDTDILITHGPPFRILDKTVRGHYVGCEDLLEKVMQIKPKLHIFGHVHEGYGTKEVNGIQFINASILNERYRYTNDPVEIEY